MRMRNISFAHSMAVHTALRPRTRPSVCLVFQFVNNLSHVYLRPLKFLLAEDVLDIDRKRQSWNF